MTDEIIDCFVAPLVDSHGRLMTLQSWDRGASLVHRHHNCSDIGFMELFLIGVEAISERGIEPRSFS